MAAAHPLYRADALDELVWQLQQQKFVDLDRALRYCTGFEAWVDECRQAGQLTPVEVDAFSADIHFVIGRIAYVRGDVDEAMRRFELGSGAAQRALVVDRQVLLLRAHARALEYAGLQARSTRLMFEAIDLAEAADDDRLRSLAMSGLGSLYESQGAYEQVLEAALKSHERALTSGDDHLLWSTYAIVGLAYGYLGRSDEALHWLKRGSDEIRADEAPELELITELYRMFVLGTIGQVDEAIDVAEQRIDEIAKLPAQHQAAAFVDVAELYLSRGDLDRAEVMLQKATDAAEHDGLKAHRLRYTKFAADLYEAKGEPAEALRMMRLHAEYSDELRGRNARIRLVAAERHFATELAKKTEEIHQLRTVELVQKNDQLEVLNRQKDEILNVVAHDLRSPLAATSMLSEMLLLEQAGSGDADLIEQLHAMRTATAEMGETIDQLLHLQRPHDPLLGTPLADVVERSVDWAIGHAAERGITVMDRIDAFAMEVDEALVRRALDDVLWVAIQAVNADDVVRLIASPHGDSAIIAVDIPGVLNEHADRTLYIARRLIERMGGSLRISNGNGATTLEIELRASADLRPKPAAELHEHNADTIDR